jgi:hypothetical protein
MNERIRELKEQAREYATTRHPVSNITLSVNSDLFEQNFAELIVKECYEHCKGQLLNSTLANEHNLSYNDGVADCAIGLLQHFGVKE